MEIGDFLFFLKECPEVLGMLLPGSVSVKSSCCYTSRRESFTCASVLQLATAG